MRFLQILFLVFFLFFQLSCATSNDSQDANSDIAEAASDTATSDAPAADTGEQDLLGDQNQAPVQAESGEPAPQDPTQVEPPPPEVAPPQEPLADTPPPQEQVPPPPAVAEQAPAPAPAAPEAAAPSGEPARLMALDYDGNTDGGTILIRTNVPVNYSTRKNAGANQFIIELPNTTVPKQFRRPYNTKEFGGPIASFTAYQGKGDEKVARIVVQMRGPAGEPGLSQDGALIKVAGSGTGGGAAVAEEGAPPTAPDAPAETESYAAEGGGGGEDGGVLTNKTINDFLTGNIKFYGSPISLEFRDAELRDVLRFIAEDKGVNILVGDDVAGKISLKLQKIPWDQALAVILQSKQLGYVKQGAVLRVAPLKALQAEADSARTVLESQKLLQPMRVQIFPVSYARADELEPQVKELLTTRGKVRADKRTNSLVVTDIEDSLAKVKKLVGKLDTQTPQVLIEAKVVEAREGFDRTIGVNWGFPGVASSGTPSITPSFTSNPATQGVVGDLTLNIGGLDVLGDLTASLRLLESERLVKVVSAPRIVTSDRKEARIEQVTQFPIQNTVQSQTGFVGNNVQFQDVRLQLVVTPHVASDGAVTLDVQIVREFPESEVGTSGARAINRRQANTQVLVDSGDTVVIGGVYQSDVSESEEGIPFLRSIPFVGWLFKRKSLNREKNELVIFLTPRILNREKSMVRGGEA